MSEAKIQIAIGSITFSGEGAPDWLEKQLDKLLKAAPDLLALEPEHKVEDASSITTGEKSKGSLGTLAAFLSDKGATSNQVKRFLATAEWLHRKGKQRLQTRDVAKALQDNHQKRLGNPADCLNKNVAKGYCEKAGNEFFITPEGRQSL